MTVALLSFLVLSSLSYPRSCSLSCGVIAGDAKNVAFGPGGSDKIYEMELKSGRPTIPVSYQVQRSRDRKTNGIGTHSHVMSTPCPQM